MIERYARFTSTCPMIVPSRDYVPVITQAIRCPIMIAFKL
jgi:hypothetical protein